MIDTRILFGKESIASLKHGADLRAQEVYERIEARMRDVGGTNRMKVAREVLAEVLLGTYLDGRASCLTDEEQRRRMSAVDDLLQTTELVNKSLLSTIQGIFAMQRVYLLFAKIILGGQALVVLLAIAMIVMMALR